MGNKKEPKTYNHYVPQFYLKTFQVIIALVFIILIERNLLMKLLFVKMAVEIFYTEKIMT